MQRDNYTFTHGIVDDVVDEMNEHMKEEVRTYVLRMLELNAMLDEDVIKEIVKDEEVLKLLHDPSEDVIAAHKFAHEL